VHRAALRAWLVEHGYGWREDASNGSSDYGRNRLRQFLANRPVLTPALRELAFAAGALQCWIEREAPTLPTRFERHRLSRLPSILGRQSARRWLIEAGVKAERLSDTIADRLCEMARDAAAPPRQHFAGSVLVRRQRGELFAQRPNNVTAASGEPSPGSPLTESPSPNAADAPEPSRISRTEAAPR